MQFYLPTRFNVIKSLNQVGTGCNVLIPKDGNAKGLQDHLVLHASSATTERMITPVLHELRTNPFSKNNLTPAESSAIDKEVILSGVAHCVYSRITSLSFRSEVFGKTLPYLDYAFLLNAILIYDYRDPYSIEKQFDEFYEWFRQRDSRIIAEDKVVRVVRGDNATWHTIDTATFSSVARQLRVEAGLTQPPITISDILSRYRVNQPTAKRILADIETEDAQ